MIEFARQADVQGKRYALHQRITGRIIRQNETSYINL